MPKRPKARTLESRGPVRARETQPTQNYDLLPPVFCLHHVSPAHCITTCDVDDRAAFATRIRLLSQLTWRQILNSPRHGVGCEKIRRDQIRAQVPTSITDDTTFLAFRFSGLKPMIGFRTQDVFHIVWFDRDMDLYAH
jgi:hypothetical protein